MTFPYKCPACDGFGVRRMPEQVKSSGSAVIFIAEHDVDCRACEGTGIVWDMELTSFSNPAINPTPATQSEVLRESQ